METLPLRLHKNTFDYTQVLRGERSCIYEKRDEGPVVYYEVFLIRIKPKRIIKGKKIEAREWFPNDEAFGVWAWSYRVHDMALNKFRELEERQTEDLFNTIKDQKNRLVTLQPNTS